MTTQAERPDLWAEYETIRKSRMAFVYTLCAELVATPKFHAEDYEGRHPRFVYEGIEYYVSFGYGARKDRATISAAKVSASISVDISRPAAKIAADIKRRLVLEVTEQVARAMKEQAERDEYEAGKQATVADLRWAFGQEANRGSGFYLSFEEGGSATIRVDGRDSITVERCYMNLKQTLQFAALVKSWKE